MERPGHLARGPVLKVHRILTTEDVGGCVQDYGASPVTHVPEGMVYILRCGGGAPQRNQVSRRRLDVAALVERFDLGAVRRWCIPSDDEDGGAPFARGHEPRASLGQSRPRAHSAKPYLSSSPSVSVGHHHRALLVPGMNDP